MQYYGSERWRERAYRFPTEDGGYMEVGFCDHNKFLARSFDLRVEQMLPALSLPESFSVALRFSGMREVTNVFPPTERRGAVGATAER